MKVFREKNAGIEENGRFGISKIIIIVLFVVSNAVSAQSKVRVDIDGTENAIALKIGEASKGLKITHGNWLKDKAKFYLQAYTNMNLTTEWQKFTFIFIPGKDGIVKIYLRGPYHKSVKKNWVAYDNITITGAEAKNCDFEHVTSEGRIVGWWCSNPTISLITAPKEAQSGKNFIIAWFRNAIIQSLKVRKNQKVTVSFWARKVEKRKSL